MVIHSSVDSKYFIYFFINLYWSIVVYFKLTFIPSILELVFQRVECRIDPFTLKKGAQSMLSSSVGLNYKLLLLLPPDTRLLEGMDPVPDP